VSGEKLSYTILVYHPEGRNTDKPCKCLAEAAPALYPVIEIQVKEKENKSKQNKKKK
jgi:hypothetical protein